MAVMYWSYCFIKGQAAWFGLAWLPMHGSAWHGSQLCVRNSFGLVIILEKIPVDEQSAFPTAPVAAKLATCS